MFPLAFSLKPRFPLRYREGSPTSVRKFYKIGKFHTDELFNQSKLLTLDMAGSVVTKV